MSACQHYATATGVCGAPTERRYLSGWCCPTHTPAALVGRSETTPDPARTLAGIRGSENLFITANETVIDARAKASGKRRSTPGDFRAAQQAVTR